MEGQGGGNFMAAVMSAAAQAQMAQYGGAAATNGSAFSAWGTPSGSSLIQPGSMPDFSDNGMAASAAAAAAPAPVAPADPMVSRANWSEWLSTNHARGNISGYPRIEFTQFKTKRNQGWRMLNNL
jgi:hypothetical protein